MHMLRRATRGGSVTFTFRTVERNARVRVCATSGDATSGDYPPITSCNGPRDA
jgi:hypothetical protein